ncbi:MAG TPA: hypothetical protein VLQ45_15655 [Thermoanaerobaculia bacterium]|nr:hypothetical protein [Thermoanaerobaculia bacterium]
MMRIHEFKRQPFARRATPLALFGIRHAVAVLATIVAACILWTVTYAALLAWAVVTNEGLGGPLAYPGGLVAAAITAAVTSLVLFLPATALAEWICRRSHWPFLAQIPVSVAVLAAVCVPVALGVQLLREVPASAASVLQSAALLFTLSLVPIGFYWWVAQTGSLVRERFRGISRWLRGGA